MSNLAGQSGRQSSQQGEASTLDGNAQRSSTRATSTTRPRLTPFPNFPKPPEHCAGTGSTALRQPDSAPAESAVRAGVGTPSRLHWALGPLLATACIGLWLVQGLWLERGGRLPHYELAVLGSALGMVAAIEPSPSLPLALEAGKVLVVELRPDRRSTTSVMLSLLIQADSAVQRPLVARLSQAPGGAVRAWTRLPPDLPRSGEILVELGAAPTHSVGEGLQRATMSGPNQAWRLAYRRRN